jgi:integrase
MYSFAAKRGIVPEGANPTRGIEKFKEVGCERYLTNDELKRLGQTLTEAETVGIPWVLDASNPKFKHTPKNDQRTLVDGHAVAALRLLTFTGARLREILHLRWEHVDLDRGLLLLPDSKTGKKTIVLNAAAEGVIRTLLATDRPPERQALVIPGDVDGQPRADLKRPWIAIKRHAGLEDLRIHDLRHTFASIGAGASLGLPIVGKLLGHSQPSTTARYAHLDADPLRRAANVIGDQLSAALTAGAGKAAK